MPLSKGLPGNNYELSFADSQAAILGSFTGVSGISSQLTKIHGLNKSTDVTLKRGVVRSIELENWLNEVRGGAPVKRDVIVTSHDESHVPVMSWRLRNATVMKYTGPTLSGKGGGDVAMEELVLVAESVEIFP
jgi:phage tail-like protein